MKNIHVLPTDKPSRLWINNLLQGKLELSKEMLIGSNTAQNIYITSDEEIKVNDYITDGYKVWQWKDDSSLLGRKKVILSTDQDLIKDGVQAIDDDFLNWFVQNPSCEFIEIVDDWNSPRIDAYEYRVIIPNLEMSIEERKPHSFCETPNEKCTMNYCDENGCQNRKRNLVPKQEPDYTALLRPVGTPMISDWLEQNRNPEIDKQVEKEAKELSKQETLEEATKIFLNTKQEFYFKKDSLLWKFLIKISQLGAKWQQDKKLYSEEEVIELLQKALTHQDDGETGSLVTAQGKIRPANFFSWFERFKKK